MPTDEQQHLEKLQHDIFYRAVWEEQHATQRNQPTSTHLMDMSAGDGSDDNWRVRLTPSSAMENFWDGVLRTFLLTFFCGAILFILFSCFVLSF